MFEPYTKEAHDWTLDWIAATASPTIIGHDRYEDSVISLWEQSSRVIHSQNPLRCRSDRRRSPHSG